jgi:Cu-Zn family superoxide dismutase
MPSTLKLTQSGALLATLALLAGCDSLRPTTTTTTTTTTAATRASAQLEATRGNTASGVVSFDQQGAGVLMLARVEGLKPNQAHGFHLHEKGDCSSGDGVSTGGHFNPTGHSHGPQDGEHHAGDLPALQADANGRAELRVTLPALTVAAGPASVVGLGLIVHAGPDDFKTQPTGNSGARIACGVVKLK